MADFGAIRGSKIFISIAAIIGKPLLSCTLGGSHIESLFAYNGRHVVCGSAAR